MEPNAWNVTCAILLILLAVRAVLLDRLETARERHDGRAGQKGVLQPGRQIGRPHGL